MTNTAQKIRPTLYEMAVGATVQFPITRLKSAGLCHFSLKIFSNELLHSSFLFYIFVRRYT